MNFDQALRLAGLHPRDIVADGKIRRCKSDMKPGHRNGWYALHPDGHGVWGDWTTGSSAALGTWKDANAAQRAVDPKVIAKLAQQREQAREDRRAGIANARKQWAAGTYYVPHKYLTDKQLGPEGCAGLRVWGGPVWTDEGRVDDTWLLVPLYWRDRLVNVQRIGTSGIKRQMKNAPQTGCSLTLGRPNAALTVFVEGLATGLAVFRAVRKARVVVAFFADNLLPVVQELKPTGSVVIAADNDHKTLAKRGFNPGIEKATNAAELIGAGVAYPEGIEGSDYADFALEVGLGADRKIERLILAKAKFVMGAMPMS